MSIFIQSLLSYMLLASPRAFHIYGKRSDYWWSVSRLLAIVKCKQANILEFKKNISALVVLFCNTWIHKELALCIYRATYTGCVLKQEIKTQRNFNPSKVTWKIKNKNKKVQKLKECDPLINHIFGLHWHGGLDFVGLEQIKSFFVYELNFCEKCLWLNDCPIRWDFVRFC